MADQFAYRYRPATVLVVSGEDAFGFLQGQFSNDLRPHGAGTVTYGLWLSVKGKVEGDAFIIQREEGKFLVVSPNCAAREVAQRLEAFIVADDVSVEDVTESWSGVIAWGSEPRDFAAKLGMDLPEGKRTVDKGGIIGFSSKRWGAASMEWLFLNGDPAADLAMKRLVEAGVSFLPAADAETQRILGGGVAVPSELGRGDLPQEAGMESIAVSFTKGCFTGQEVMARLRSMGRVRRGLVLVRGEGECPSIPVPLFSDDRNIGELRSIGSDSPGSFVGRAMVTLTNLPSKLRLGTPDSSVRFVTWDEPPAK